MNEKTSDNAELVGQFTDKVHGFVDRFQERAAGMEKVAGDRSVAMFSERAQAKIERKMSKLEGKLDKFQGYAEKNPMMASMMAFGVGALSTRVLKGRAAAKADLTEEVSSEEPKKTAVSKKAKVSKAA